MRKIVTQAQIEGLGQFTHRGFTLEHPDDHVLFLMHEGERIGVFSQTGATPESLQAECARHLAGSIQAKRANEPAIKGVADKTSKVNLPFAA
ncbi:hypothetical protein ES703_66701 [subsurface metagenome]